MPRPSTIRFRCYTAMLRADNVNDLSISLMKPPHEDLIDLMGGGFPPAEYNTGGMSGGPIAVFRETEHGIVTWSIAAIIYEGHSTYEIIKGMRADLINDDGMINEAI
jgi:hypothetical protein